MSHAVPIAPRRLVGLTLCLALSAASTAAQPLRRPAAADRQPGEASVFISPCGQPFRAGPGERNPLLNWFAKADLNGDGLLDRDEFRADASAFFKVLDENGDGVISGFEVSRYEHTIAPEVLGGFTMGMRTGGAQLILAQDSLQDIPATTVYDDGRIAQAHPIRRSVEGAAPYGLLGDIEPVSAADLDLDGRVTLAEFLKTSDRRFARLDTKGAGKLALNDLPLTLQEEKLRQARADARPVRSLKTRL